MKFAIKLAYFQYLKFRDHLTNTQLSSKICINNVDFSMECQYFGGSINYTYVETYTRLSTLNLNFVSDNRLNVILQLIWLA